MSGAQYGERGGVTALRATPALQQPSVDRVRPSNHVSYGSKNTQSKDNFQQSLDHLRSSNVASGFPARPPFGAEQMSSGTTDDVLDLPVPESIARAHLLRDAVFPDWKDASGEESFESPEEMQKKDPLGTQIWKLYSRTKTRLPNQERMENLTWRMMAMNLKRREQQSKALCVISVYASFLKLTCM